MSLHHVIPHAEPSAPPRILIVEDDPPSRALLRRRLRREGWETCEASDGSGALALLEQESISAVLLDIGLPGMSGIDVLKRIRQNHCASELPIIMVTAFDQEEYLAEAFAAGADDFIDKPVDFAILKARLRARLHLSAAHRQTQQLKNRLELILEGANDGVWEWSAESGSVRHSLRWNAMLGLDAMPENHAIADWLERIHPEDCMNVARDITRVLGDPTCASFRLEYRIQRGDNRYLWILTRGAAQRDAQGTCLRMAGTHTDIGPLRYVDRLTGLPNLQQLIDELNYQRAHADGAGRLGAILIRLNDVDQGPETASERYREIGRLGAKLQDQLPECLMVGSGENAERLILLVRSGADDDDAFVQLARRALAVMRTGIETPAQRAFFHGHAGIACYAPAQTPDAESLLAAARLAAREASVQAQDVYLFDEHLETRVQRHQRLSALLPEALENGGIAPWWQPVISATGRLAGFECLARWRLEEGSYVPPDEFIPLVETTGMIPRMTEQLLEYSLARLATWIEQNRIVDDAYMSVNFTPSMLDPRQLPEYLLDAVGRHGLRPGNLCVEMTESTAVTEYEETQICLRRLGELGFKLALDDFGTGYASLSTLHRLPFDTLKIDQSFVRSMEQDAGAEKLVNAIVAIARALDLELVAEGVETETQASRLRDAGVDRLQGFLFARPMPETTLLDWLESNHGCTA